MNEEITKKLDKAIENEIENLSWASDEEKPEVIKNLAALHKLRIDEYAQNAELEFKNIQIREGRIDRYTKIGIAAAELILPLTCYGIWMRMGLRFEQTGSFTSQTFKNLFNRFKPTKKG